VNLMQVFVEDCCFITGGLVISGVMRTNGRIVATIGGGGDGTLWNMRRTDWLETSRVRRELASTLAATGGSLMSEYRDCWEGWTGCRRYAG